MLRFLTRLVIILVIIGAIIWFFAPSIINGAANSVIGSGNSAVKGLAQFVPTTTTVKNNATVSNGELQVKVDNLLSTTPYEVTLDTGQCGTIAKDLGKVVTDRGGSFYIEFPLSKLNTNSTWYVDVHKQGVNGVSVACGLLENNQTASSQVITSSPQSPAIFGNTSNQSTALPNTGADPGNGQSYDNNQYPRKY